MMPAGQAPALAEHRMSTTTDQKDAGAQALARTGTGTDTGVITTPDQFRSSLAKWQQQRFHILTPSTNFSGGLPEGWGLVASQVEVNPDPTVGEVYQDRLFCGDDEVAIAKNGLSKIARAAGMTIKTERCDPRTIPHFWEVRATIRFTGQDGALQEIDSTAEYDLRDGSPRINKIRAAAERAKPRRDPTSQIEGARQYGLRGAEARAINAAIRQFGIKQKYTKKELDKPFITLRMQFFPDMRDPETRRQVTERALAGTTALYGGTMRALNPPQQVIDADVTSHADETAIDTTARAEQPRPEAQSPPKTETRPATGDNEPPTPHATRIVKIDTKQGTSAKGPWTRWDIVCADGTESSTFNKDIASDAQKFLVTREWVDVLAERKGNYSNIIEITKAQPELPMEEDL